MVQDKPYFAFWVLFVISFISLIGHWNHLSKDIISYHAWRQTQTQSTIINFYEEDMNILNPRRNFRGDGDGIFRMEFPLAQWFVAVLYKIFGPKIWVSRLFMFFCGILSTIGIYKLTKSVLNNSIAGLIAAWTLTFSPSFFYYTINPLPDNLALTLGIWGLFFSVQWRKKNKNSTALLSGLFLAFAALVKLPFILLYGFPLGIYVSSMSSWKEVLKNSGKLFFVFVPAILPVTWYLWVIPTWSGNGIVKGVLDNQISISKFFDLLTHNVISTLPELLLNYGSLPLFLFGLMYVLKEKTTNPSPISIGFWFTGILLSSFFLYEINMIGKVHDYYLFPFLPLLFLVVGLGGISMIEKGGFLKWFAIVCLTIIPITCFLRLESRWDVSNPGINKNLLAYKNELQDAVPKDKLCIVGNDRSGFIYFYYIDKKGWSFHSDNLNKWIINDYILRGARFLYCDSRAVDTNPEITPFFDSLLMKKGDVYVFRLLAPTSTKYPTLK